MKKVLLFLLIPFIISYSQISIQVGNSVSQNFDGLGTSATATMPSGWKVDKNTSIKTVGTYQAAVTATEKLGGNSMSSSASNGIYNFGLGDQSTATDRAVGGLSSGSASKSVNIYSYLQNNGSSTIKRVDVSYDVYRFRNGSNAAGFTIQLYYSTDGTTWTSAGANFTSTFAPNSNSDGGTVPLETKNIINQTISGLNIAAGGSLYLAWNYSVTSGATTSSAQALGIDNFIMNNILASDQATAPNAPVAMAATNLSTSGFTANWNTSAGATGYYLDVSTSNSFGSFTGDFNNKNVGNVASYVVTGLAEKTKYYYRVWAFNATGKSTLPSGTITVTTDSIITSVQFTGIANAVPKSAGKYDLTLSITNPSTVNATTCVVSVVYDSSYTNISSMTSFTSGVVTFPAGSSASQKVTVNINNDGISERSRKAYFLIHNVSGGLNAASKTGTQPYFWLTIMSGKDNNYYSAINTNLTGNDLKTALHNLIKGHTTYPYSDNTTDLWDILQDTDEDPTNPSNVVGIYSGMSIYKYQHVSSSGSFYDWNKEHVWSKSHGNFGTSNGAGTDAHHLRAENANVNTLKSNLDFDNGGTAVPNAPGCLYDADSWEPRDAVKGDIARMIFYMATRYQGENGEPNLSVVDYVNTSPNNEPLYGKLSTLLQWNIQDPVDDNEINRNNNVYAYQHNRNPYIDHPEWITSIWGGPTTAVPAAPAAASASNVSVSGFTANWSASATATGYYLYVATDNAFSNVLSSYNGKDVGNVTTSAVTGLSGSTTYYYRVKAYNAGGPSVNYSNIVSLLTVPAAPVAIAGTKISNTSFAANWSASAGAAGYYIDIATDAGFTTPGYNGFDVGNVLTYTVAGISSNTNYYYRVRAYNAGGQSANSNTITVNIAVGIEADAIPANYYLFQNYPNPFNPTTMIKFSLKKGSAVKIMLYDIAGREIETLVNTQYSAGTHSIRFDASNLANGIYFYRIITDEFSDIKKMVLMK